MNHKTLVERLRDHRVILKSGDYDGAQLMRAWCDMINAADTIEAQATRIEALEAALREIVKDEGGWALNYASDTERWYSKFVLGPMGKIAKQALENKP